MNIIALDLGTTTGWAAIIEGRLTSGSLPLKRQDDNMAMRCLRLESHLNKIHEDSNQSIRAIFFESVTFSHSSSAASHIYGALKSEAQRFAIRHNLAIRGYTPGQIKRHGTGKGNAPKEAMIHYAALKYPDQTIIDDNQADALHLLNLALSELS